MAQKAQTICWSLIGVLLLIFSQGVFAETSVHRPRVHVQKRSVTRSKAHSQTRSATREHWQMDQTQAYKVLCSFARLSVYAIYCDPRNERGLNTALYNFRLRSRHLDEAAERAFGGHRGEAIHEDFRNDISYEWLHQDRDATCARDQAMFEQVVNAPFEESSGQLWRIGSCAVD